MLSLLLRSIIFACLILLNPYANAGWCEDSGGIRKHGQCFCPGLGRFINQRGRRACLDQIVRLSSDSIAEFNNQIFNPCEPQNFVNQNLKCPGHLLVELEENKNPAWLGVIESPNEICLNYNSKDEFFKNTREFERFLHDQQGYKLNTRDDLISQCLNGKDYPERQKNAFVAKYYRDMSRLKKGVLGNIQSIANIDSILGNPPPHDNFWDLSSGVCENQHIELSVSWCRKFKEDCRPQGGLDQLALRTYEHLPIYLELLKKKQSLEEDSIESKKVSLALASIEGNFPWIKGDQFKSRVRTSSKRNPLSVLKVKEGIKRQLLEDRRNHLKNLQNQQGAAHCLNSTYPVRGCSDYKKALSSTPELPRLQMQELSFANDEDLYDENGNKRELTPEEQQEMRGRAQVTMANGYLDDAKCVEDMRGLRSDVNWHIGMAAGQLAITGLTMGAGAIALPGAVAARAGSFVARAVNHSKVAWNAMKTGVGRGRLMVKGALLGSSAMGEAYLMKDEVRSLVDACDSHLPEPTSVSTDEDFIPNCPRAPKYNNGRIQSLKSNPSQTDWQDCALSSALMGLGVIPILGDVAGRKIKKLWQKSKVARENANQLRIVEEGIAGRLINGGLTADDIKILKEVHSDRLEDAVAVLGRDLSDTEKLAILKAHYVGFGELGKDRIHLAGLENYTQGHITAKARSLFQAGLTRPEVQKLMDSGITGMSSMTGDAMAKAQRAAKVERYLELAENDPNISEAVINSARKRDLESFDVVDGNLVLANNPNQVMIRSNIDIGDVEIIPTPKAVTPQRTVATTTQVSDALNRTRRELGMSLNEVPILNSMDLKSVKWVNSPRLGRRVLCGKTKKRAKTYRREKTSADIARLSRPKRFSYHGQIPSAQVLDRHLSSTRSNGYMGLATTMNDNLNSIAGNGGKKRANICINPGALICIIGGAESEVVLMDSNWGVCAN